MNETILIVDDEMHILNGLKTALQHFSYKPLTASSGAEALDILSSEEVDLIIADINMPEIDGKKILDAVKQIEPNTPVIIITGVHVDEVQDLARKWGAADYLAKPFTPVELAEKIKISLKIKEEKIREEI